MRRALPAVSVAPLICTRRSISSQFPQAVDARRAKGPTLDDLRQMPRHISELSNDLLFLMTKLPGGSLPASRERLRRDIMFVDGVSYEDAGYRIVQIARYGRVSASLLKAPYYFGMAAAYVGGYLSIPLVFSLSIAHSFNESHVKADPPDEGVRPPSGATPAPRLAYRTLRAALHPRTRPLCAWHRTLCWFWQPTMIGYRRLYRRGHLTNTDPPPKLTPPPSYRRNKCPPWAHCGPCCPRPCPAAPHHALPPRAPLRQA